MQKAHTGWHIADEFGLISTSFKIIMTAYEDLNGHIYDVGTRSQADKFTATTKALVSYTGPSALILKI